MLLDSLLMRLDDFDYSLPPAQIAQRPLDRRDASRLLELHRAKGTLKDRLFSDLPDLLRGDELLVLNNTKVIPARLFGRRAGVHAQPPSRATRREHLTGKVEIFLTRQHDPQTWEALVRPGRKMQTGERVLFGEGELEAEVISRGDLGLRTLRFVSRDTHSVSENLERLGHVPLPPYIHRTDEGSDRERYQTVFAKQPGAIAAPTAGLHFTQEILEKIRARGVEICEVTLEVGLGTFQPVHTETLEAHVMHAESYEISPESAQRIKDSTRCEPPHCCRRHYRRSRARSRRTSRGRSRLPRVAAFRQSRRQALHLSGISLPGGRRAAYKLSSAALDAPGPGMRFRRL